MNDLEQYFRRNPGKRIHKWTHFFEIYDSHFSRFRGSDVHLLEIGIDSGGSLEMWRHYFGRNARIFGSDLNPGCKALEADGFPIFIGDQNDRRFLRETLDAMGRIDIVIDDGGHDMDQQTTTFQEIFPRLTDGGIYVCEDISSSYIEEFGGGYRRKGTFVEYAKGFVDAIHAWHSEDPKRFAVSDLTRSIHGIHFYNNALIIEKRNMSEPKLEKTGERTIPLVKEIFKSRYQPSFGKRIVRKLKSLTGVG